MNSTPFSRTCFRYIFQCFRLGKGGIIQVRQSSTGRDLSEIDPEVHAILRHEKQRQRKSLNLIASENYTSQAVLQALGSCVHNKTSEGMVGTRYYGSCGNIDKLEQLCKDRALAAYRLDPALWGVNVQTLSGSIANFAAYQALLQPHDRIMGLYLSDGGHLTHGYRAGRRKMTASSKFFETMSYRTDRSNGLIDYDQLHEWAVGFEPNLIIAGITCYPRHLDYRRFREIADDVGAYLLGDIAHISGLVAAGIGPNPFEHCHVVTTTTYKSLRGPRTAMILYRKVTDKPGTREGGKPVNLDKLINEAVFPGTHGAPHNHAITSLAVALKEVMDPEFSHYQHKVVKNCKMLAECLQTRGYDLITGGTDINMLLVNLASKGIDGDMAQTILEEISIDVNKNTCPGDVSPLRPSGIRLGTSALTSRGLAGEDMKKVVEFLDQGLMLAKKIKQMSENESKAFKTVLHMDTNIQQEVMSLRELVQAHAGGFSLPGMDLV